MRKKSAARAEPAPQEAAPLRVHQAPPGRRRRSFSQSNLELTHSGPLGEALGRALSVPERSGYEGTHAFHPYPGRFHPALPADVLKALAEAGMDKGAQVFDPFMGGGTALVEAMGMGLAALGNDLNPVALLVARERTRPRSPAEARRVNNEARRIAGLVEALRHQKDAPRVHLKQQGRLAPHYQRHLLAEFMQWLRLIGQLAPGGEQETLRAVFSSAVVKFSNLASDSRPGTVTPPRYPKGAVSRFLVDKCEELTSAQAALSRRIPPGTPPARLFQEDARELPSLAPASVAAVLTSPPYPGTYDYHHQHRLRMDWLDLDGSALLNGELGARRDGTADKPSGGWSHDLRAVLKTLARVIRPGGSLVMALGDWMSAGHAVDAATALVRAAQAEGWAETSRASVRRAVHSRQEKKAYARRGKWEHLLHFTRAS